MLSSLRLDFIKFDLEGALDHIEEVEFVFGTAVIDEGICAVFFD